VKGHCTTRLLDPKDDVTAELGTHYYYRHVDTKFRSAVGRKGAAHNSMMHKMKHWDKGGNCVSTNSLMQKCWGKGSYHISTGSWMQKVI